MISKELTAIIEQIKKQGKMRFPNGAAEDQIADFENKHNIKFPSKYREWLRFCDGGEFFQPAGVQMYGVAHKPIIDVFNNDRPSSNYIVIGALASGDPILCEKGNETISIYNHVAGRIESDEIYKDFYAFLNDLYEMLGIGG